MEVLKLFKILIIQNIVIKKWIKWRKSRYKKILLLIRKLASNWAFSIKNISVDQIFDLREIPKEEDKIEIIYKVLSSFDGPL